MPGGGLNIFAEYANISLENCVFTNNIAGYGGGADIETYYGTITVTNNIFNQNSSDYDGGGAYISGETVTLTDNIFTNNSIAGGYGGGLAFSSQTGSLSLIRNRFVNNSNSDPEGWSGGADIMAQTVTMVNNVFSGNSAVDAAGGVYLYVSGDLNIINNTIVNNQAENSGGGLYFQTPGDTSIVNAYNNIIWGNAAGAGADFYSLDDNPNLTINYFNNDVGVYYTYCAVNPTCLTVINDGNNINSDPKLTADFHLTKGSPCINAGDNNAPNLPATDFEGNPRVIGGTVDIGADEYRALDIVDFNGDGKADILWRNTSTGQNAVWYMDGVTLSGIGDLPALPNPDYAIVGTGDFNGDGKTDILWRNTTTRANAVWYMNGVTLSGISDLPPFPIRTMRSWARVTSMGTASPTSSGGTRRRVRMRSGT